MLFRNAPTPALAISQPAHAWVSGQLLRHWATPLDEPLLLASEQHDIGWLDWETAPTFDPQTGRPHLFRDVHAATHAPMWAKGVDRALAAYGTRVALLVSRHGSVIYTRFNNHAGLSDADAAASTHFLETQAVKQAAWAQALGLEDATLERDTALVALSDTLSLALCGELAVPLSFDAPGRVDSLNGMHLDRRPDGTFTLAPWPFRGDEVVVACEARALPATGRFDDEAAMQTWFARPEREILRLRLVPG